MRIRKLVYATILLLALSSCNKEEEHYESKNVKVDSVFDKADDSKESEADKDKSKNEDKEKEEKTVNQSPKNDDQSNENKDTNKDDQGDNQDNPPSDKGKKYRTKDGLNLRRNPNIEEDNIIDVIDKGTELESIEELNANGFDWIKINFEGKEGYLSKDLLEEVNN